MKYLLEEIERGQGFFTSGERTMIYRTLDGMYVTAAKSDSPSPTLTLVGGGTRDPRGGRHTPQIDWC